MPDVINPTPQSHLGRAARRGNSVLAIGLLLAFAYAISHFSSPKWRLKLVFVPFLWPHLYLFLALFRVRKLNYSVVSE